MQYLSELSAYAWYIISFFYVLIAVINYGYYGGKFGHNGLDGLIPSFMAIFWPIIIPVRVIFAIICIPYYLGRRIFDVNNGGL